ncbi:MAG: glutamine-hydrolyzing GMP synthase [Spirochaetes bacterium]|nr:glutamine-hydrolyzing GMP synthase [Spirochaetota bacterium]
MPTQKKHARRVGDAQSGDKIVVLDFGSQYTQLIARRLRELRFYAEIHPHHLSLTEIKKLNPAGIILSGGPASVYEKGAPSVDKNIFSLGVPILGICYGLQLICHLLGGKVAASAEREYGRATLRARKASTLLKGIKAGSAGSTTAKSPNQVWMSHGDKIIKLPKNFSVIAVTENSPAAAFADEKARIFGVQFHPEVQHSTQGKTILKNFAGAICGVKPTWTMSRFVEEKMAAIREQVKHERVLLGLSGGVDSTVTAKLLHDAIGDQLTCVYVDTGLMRKGETEAVRNRFKKEFGIKLHVVDAEERFLTALAGVDDPEKKRKIIGKLFLDEFSAKAKDLGHHEFLAQGTLYTDVIESVSVKGPSQTIKSHHNRVQGVLDLIQAGRVIEPLSELFKDEVRRLGLALKIHRDLLYRHPFPGPGLAIRILTAVTKENLTTLREADAILLDELKSSRWYEKIWQAGAIFLPVRSVGVMGDNRTYENVIALRLVTSEDGMTADFAHLPYEVLAKIASRIINEVRGVNRVVYDVSSKPPATIEWE